MELGGRYSKACLHCRTRRIKVSGSRSTLTLLSLSIYGISATYRGLPALNVSGPAGSVRDIETAKILCSGTKTKM